MSMFLIIDLTRQLPVQSNISKQRFGIVNANIYYYTKLILKFDLSSIVISDEFSINKCDVEKIAHLIYSKRSVLVQKLRFMHVKSQRGQDFALLPIFEYEYSVFVYKSKEYYMTIETIALDTFQQVFFFVYTNFRESIAPKYKQHTSLLSYYLETLLVCSAVLSVALLYVGVFPIPLQFTSNFRICYTIFHNK